MYDGLYSMLPADAEIVVHEDHPTLNRRVAELLGAGERIDVLSTHSKYAPSQSAWLQPLDGGARGYRPPVRAGRPGARRPPPMALRPGRRGAPRRTRRHGGGMARRLRRDRRVGSLRPAASRAVLCRHRAPRLVRGRALV